MQYIKAFRIFLFNLWESKYLISELTKQDFKNRYLGSYLGFIWAFIQPITQICIMWFVFQMGFRVAPVNNVPFILWLIAGMIPWFFISDSISNGAFSVIENSFLVKKVVFRVSSLALIKTISALIIHLFFIAFLFIAFMIYGFFPTVHYFQIFYYLFGSIILIMGITWITSSVIVFHRDIGQIVSLVLQFAFWFTPIFWSANMFPEKYRDLFYLNPLFYITNGYRNVFINHMSFWDIPLWATVYFWGISAGTFVLGAFLFRRLRPHFADVL